MQIQTASQLTENQIGTIIVDRAMAVHRHFGPGLLESVYEVVLAAELQERGLAVQRQVPISITYRGFHFDEAFRADLIVGGKVIVELKSVETLTKAHYKQVLTYLRLADMKLGYLLNFAEAFMRDGTHRIVNGLE